MLGMFRKGGVAPLLSHASLEEEKMGKSTWEETLNGVLAEAGSIAAERTRILDAIRKDESDLSEFEGERSSALKRVANEEFEAAQAKGGLAVASEAAQQAVAKVDLRIKSARLRLQGLRSKLAEAEKKLFATWKQLEQLRDEFLQNQFSKLADRFDEQIEAVVQLFRLGAALRISCVQSSKTVNFGEFTCHRIFLYNPFRPTGKFLEADLLRERGKEAAMLSHSWQHDPEARQLNSEIEAILARIAPIGTLVKEIGNQ
jgi:hypothetical protein